MGVIGEDVDRARKIGGVKVGCWNSDVKYEVEKVDKSV